MIQIGAIEKRFLQIVGVRESYLNFFDMQNKNMPILYVSSSSRDKQNGYKETVNKYESPECIVETIRSSEYVNGTFGGESRKKQIIRVVRGDLSYALERDYENDAWIIYIADSEKAKTDYRLEAPCISTQLIYDCFNKDSKVTLLTTICSVTGKQTYIRAEDDIIIVCGDVCQQNGVDSLKFPFTPMNYEKVLAESIRVASNNDKSKHLKDFLSLLCNEIFDMLYTEVIPMENREKVYNDLLQRRAEFNKYFANGNRQISEDELCLLNSLGIELGEFNHGYGCNMLFDSDTTETFRYFGMRQVKNGFVDKRIYTHALSGANNELNCVSVDIADELPKSDTEDYYGDSKPNKEIRVVRNEMEFVLQYYKEEEKPSITLYIGNPERNYYTNNKHQSYYDCRRSMPHVEITRLKNTRIYVRVYGKKCDEPEVFTFDAHKIYVNGGRIPFTIENLQDCLEEKLQSIRNSEIRREFIYQLPLLCEVIPTLLVKDGIEEIINSRCDHEFVKVESSKERKGKAERLKSFSTLLTKFNEHSIIQAENKASGARQKTIDEA